jgi:hypothetical protein
VDHVGLIERLEHNAEAIRSLAIGVGPRQAVWKPRRGAWSLLEVVCHLRDEEREDFRVRVESTLFRPEAAWPPIDPVGWVRTRGYRKQNLAAVRDEFVTERARSVGWLRGLGEIDWSRGYAHPQLGTLRAGDLLLAWVAHDSLHLRQLARLHYLYAQDRAPEFSADYAGEW